MFLKCCRNTFRHSVWVLMMVLVCSVPSHARIFDISKQTVGTYLRGTYGMSALGDSAFSASSGSGTLFSDEVGLNSSAEFGVYMGAGALGLRLSVERVAPGALEGIIGADSGGTALMNLDSSASALVYKLSFEYSKFLSPQSKIYFVLGAGSAAVNLTNQYTLTTAGTAAYPSVASFTEKAQETLIMGEMGLGYEYNFSADTTVMVDLSWRQMQAKKLTQATAGTGFDGPINIDDPVLNSSGSARALDFSGLTVGFGLRFYINN